MSIAKLDEVFCSLSLALEINLKLYWLTEGAKFGEVYKKKLDMTWNQINQLGLRISQLGASPTMNPGQQQQKSGLNFDDKKSDLPNLVSTELRAEDEICIKVRGNFSTLQAGQDWSSTTLLGDIIVQREDIFHQQETLFEYEPVLEHIWNEEEINMDQQEPKPQNPMH